MASTISPDIRINRGIRKHPKYRRYKVLSGREDAMEYLIEFFSWVAGNFEDGVLTGCDEYDIAAGADWPGDPQVFVAALLSCGGNAGARSRPGFLEKRDGLYVVHDWAEHQKWVAEGPQRRAQAKKGAKARWDKEKDGGPEQMDLPGAGCSEHAASICPSPFPSLPPLTRSSPQGGSSPRAHPREDEGGTPPPGEDEEAGELMALEAQLEMARLTGSRELVPKIERRIRDVEARARAQEKARGP